MAELSVDTLEQLPVRERLLNAAELVASRNGVSNLTLESVAREAGVSKGGLLYHFPSKSDLIVGVVERLATRCESEQKQALALDAESPGAFTRAYIAARAEPPDPKVEPIHAALIAAAGSSPQYLDPIRKRFVVWQAALESDGIDPAVACIVRLAMDGMCICAVLGLPVPTGEQHQQVIQTLMAMTRNKDQQTGRH